MAAQAVLDAAIEFCENSMVIRDIMDAGAITAGEATYALSAPAGQRVSRVLQAWLDGEPLAPTLADSLNMADATTGTPGRFYITRYGSGHLLNLYPNPRLSGGLLRAEVVLCPTRSATMLEDDLCDLWVDAVVSGAKARLMLIPDQPFSNNSLGMYHTSAALALIRRARIEGAKGQVRGSMRVAPHPFF